MNSTTAINSGFGSLLNLKFFINPNITDTLTANISYTKFDFLDSSGLTIEVNTKSDTVEIVTVIVKPDTPVFITQTSTDTDGNYTIQWSNVTGTDTYTLQRATASDFSNAIDVNANNATIKNITNDTNGIYYYRIKANNIAGSSNWSNTIMITVNIGALFGDFNNDRIINLSDFYILAGAWLKTTGQSGFDSRADYNNDGVINVTDFYQFSANWGKKY